MGDEIINETKALGKLIENGISILSYKDRSGGDKGSIIRNALVKPDGRISFTEWKRSTLLKELRQVNSFVLSVLMEGAEIKEYEIYLLGSIQLAIGRDQSFMVISSLSVNRMAFMASRIVPTQSFHVR